MNLDHPPEDREQARGYVSEAVREGVMLAKLDWERHLSEEHIKTIDERITLKIDKMKVWLFGGVLVTIAANAIPLALMLYQFGSFAGEVRTQLSSLSGSAPSGEVNRRFDEIERRVGQLETYHRQGGR